MRFTREQYEAAIANLQDAMVQLVPEARCCAVCGDSGHLAYECGHNPLVAMAICKDIATNAETLHEEAHAFEAAHDVDPDGPVQAMLNKLHSHLHRLAGWDSHMGVRIGPGRVVLP